MMIEKTYKVPEEIQDLFAKGNAMKILRDLYTKCPFGYKKAVKCSVAAVKADRKAWQMIYNLYPELRAKSITYSPTCLEVTLILSGKE